MIHSVRRRTRRAPASVAGILLVCLVIGSAQAASVDAASEPPPVQGATTNGAKQAAPALDLSGLEKQLKETKAIGIITKLTLKNQVDDLVSRFRAYYQGRLKTTLAELRQPYELLIFKIVSLVQDDDPPLARTIIASREPLWGILSDPVKFAALDND